MNIHALLNAAPHRESRILAIRQLLDEIVERLGSTELARGWRTSLEGGLSSREVQTSSSHQTTIHRQLVEVHKNLGKFRDPLADCQNSDFFFYSDQIPPAEQLFDGMNLDESALPLNSWFRNAVSNWTFRIASTLKDYYPGVAEDLSNSRLVEQIVASLKTIAQLPKENWSGPSTYDNARSDLQGINKLAQTEQWGMRKVYNNRKLQDTTKVATMIREVVKVIVGSHRTPRKFWYLWIPTRASIEAILPTFPQLQAPPDAESSFKWRPRPRARSGLGTSRARHSRANSSQRRSASPGPADQSRYESLGHYVSHLSRHLSSRKQAIYDFE